MRRFIICTLHQTYSNDKNRGGCEGWGRGETCIRIFVAGHEGTRPLGKLLYGWEDNIKMYFTQRV